jgi:hypothetical protein
MHSRCEVQDFIWLVTLPVRPGLLWILWNMNKIELNWIEMGSAVCTHCWPMNREKSAKLVFKCVDGRKMIYFHGFLGNMQCKCHNMLKGGCMKFPWSMNTICVGREGIAYMYTCCQGVGRYSIHLLPRCANNYMNSHRNMKNCVSTINFVSS